MTALSRWYLPYLTLPEDSDVDEVDLIREQDSKASDWEDEEDDVEDEPVRSGEDSSTETPHLQALVYPSVLLRQINEAEKEFICKKVFKPGK